MSEEPEKLKLPRAEIQAMIDKSLSGGKYVTHADLEKNIGETPGREAREHAHKPEEFMPSYVRNYKCPDGNCGRIHENPKYKKAEAYCSDCGDAYGTVEDAKKAEKCPGCGSTNNAIRIDAP